MIETSARLLALLSLLQVRREWTGSELAERLEVGPRTNSRDVDKLRIAGVSGARVPGVAGGYRLGSRRRVASVLLETLRRWRRGGLPTAPQARSPGSRRPRSGR